MKFSKGICFAGLIAIFILTLFSMPDTTAQAVSNGVVISQVYGGGGNTNAVYKNDFVELFNRGTSAVDMTGWALWVYYASTVEVPSWSSMTLSGMIQPGQYFLIQLTSSGNVGGSLPTPDATGTMRMLNQNGVVALVIDGTPIADAVPHKVIDLVGFKTASGVIPYYETSAAPPPPDHDKDLKRKLDGCQDTDNNFQDFEIVTPDARNSASPAHYCPTNPSGIGSATPSTVIQGGTSLLEVAVTGGTNPLSTGLGVTCDLTAVSGSASQLLYDNGLHGDAVSGDNIFSISASMAATTTGAMSLPCTIHDAEGRSASVSIDLTIEPSPPGAFSKTSPTDTVGDQLLAPTLNWGSSAGATSYSYCYATSTGCTNWVSVGMVTSVGITNLAQGATYYWQVKAVNSYGETIANSGTYWSFTTGTKPVAFDKTTPATGATGQSLSLNLNWGSSAGATSYSYCYATSTGCTTWISVDTAKSASLSGLAPGATYYWQVKADNIFGTTYANSGTYWSFTTGDVPEAFGKTSPPNLATDQSLTPTLSWGTSTGAASYSYCFATAPGCTNWVNNGTAKNASIGGLTLGTTYYWQVKADNGFGTTYANGILEAYWSFTTGSLPGSFGKIAPANGAANQLANLTLSWGASSGATSYDYCYAKTNPCSNWASAGTATSKALTGLTAGSTYYWNVRAVNANGFTYANASATNWSFTTGALPAAFAKIAPSNNATNQPSNPVLSWGASTGAEQYAYCIGIATPCTVWSVIGTNLSTTVNGLAPATTYYWQIRATNSFGTVYANGSTTATWSFTTPALGAPALTYLTPAQVQAGSAGFTMTIIGANFTPFVDGAEVLWDGVARTTTFVSPTELLVDVPAADVATVDSVSITVRNPDLTVSNALTFNVYTFADVLPGVWSYRYVEGFFAKGITTGCNVAPFRYCPDRAVTRAEMAVFILRSIHSDALPYTPNPAQTGVFADVPVTGKEWMQPWIEEFYGDGYTTGCGYSGSTLLYCPERQVTRAEMAVFVLRAIHGASYQPPAVTVSSFSDVPVAGKEWMMPWMEEFYVEGLTTGCRQVPTLQYCPEQSVNRAEMATFLDRAFSFPQLP